MGLQQVGVKYPGADHSHFSSQERIKFQNLLGRQQLHLFPATVGFDISNQPIRDEPTIKRLVTLRSSVKEAGKNTSYATSVVNKLRNCTWCCIHVQSIRCDSSVFFFSVNQVHFQRPHGNQVIDIYTDIYLYIYTYIYIYISIPIFLYRSIFIYLYLYSIYHMYQSLSPGVDILNQLLLECQVKSF